MLLTTYVTKVGKHDRHYTVERFASTEIKKYFFVVIETMAGK